MRRFKSLCCSMCLAGNVWNFFSNFVWNSRDHQDKIVTVKGKTNTNGYLFQNEKHSLSIRDPILNALRKPFQAVNQRMVWMVCLFIWKKWAFVWTACLYAGRLSNMNLVYGLALHQFSVAQVDRASSGCLGGHRFESCGGLRFFLRPTLVTYWSFHFLKISILLNGLPIRSKNVETSVRIVKRSVDYTNRD